MAWTMSDVDEHMNTISNTPLSEYEIEDVKIEKKKRLLFETVLPKLASSGNLDLIKEIVNKYGEELYFTMANAIIESGEEEYLGNAEEGNKVKPSDFHYNNLLHIAFQRGHDDMLVFFIKELKKAGMNPLEHIGRFEEIAYFIEEHAANLAGGRRRKSRKVGRKSRKVGRKSRKVSRKSRKVSSRH